MNGCTFQSLAGIYKITRYEIKFVRHELAFKLPGTKALAGITFIKNKNMPLFPFDKYNAKPLRIRDYEYEHVDLK